MPAESLDGKYVCRACEGAGWVPAPAGFSRTCGACSGSGLLYTRPGRRRARMMY